MRQAFTIMKALLMLVLFLPGILAAQEFTVTGKVTDKATGETLPGVYVLIKGTNTGAATDINGNYSVKVPDGNAVLVFSSLGYIGQEVSVGPNQVIDIFLEVDVKELEEVVVIGYGTVKKSDATGSVSVVGTNDFNKGAISSPQELLVGKSAGVVITTADGAPGSNATIRIRGGSSLKAKNDPLIIIDGFPVENADISGLSNALTIVNPNDIESVTVLKDASATAIYGSRASNGVIIITTKKGKEGVPLRLSYNGNISLGTPVKLLEVLDGNEFRSILQDRVTNYGLTSAALDRLGDANTDWQKEIYHNAISTDHNLSITGNVKSTPYRASVGYTNQNGILKNSRMNRATIDLGANRSFLDKHLDVSANVKVMNAKHNFSNPDAIGSAIEFDPTQPIKNGNTRYGGYTAWTELSSGDPINGVPNNIATHNPVARLEYRDDESNVWRSIGNLQLDYIFHNLPDLRANLNMGYDYSESKGHNNINPLASWSYREPSQNVKNYNQTLKSQLFDFYLNYVKQLDVISSKVDITAGYSWQHFFRDKMDANRPWTKTEGVYVGADTISKKSENYLVSFFGRLNYTFMGRYLLTATIRDDGSSRFSKANRWGLFPSVALAWKINEESFLANVGVISELKLRLGYGITGQQDIGDNYYPYLATYKTSQTGAYYQFGDQFYSTLRPNPYDENIKWEETTTKNIGLDFGFLNDRIAGSFDYYFRTTDDLINEIPIAVGTNFSNYLTTNVGSLENKGFEVTLKLRPISVKDMSWEIGGTVSYNENKITKLNRVKDPSYPGYYSGVISGGVDNRIQINSVGHPANTFNLFKQVYNHFGMPIEGLYVDKTGSGGDVTANNANKYYLGKPAADYLIGVSSRFTYKAFDLSFSGRFSIGNYVYNNNASNRALYQNLYNQSGYLSNILTDINRTRFSTAQYFSDFYLEDASFFRMDNINLGYSFNKLFTDNLNGRISFTVQNVFVVTNYTGLDPELNIGGDTPGIDKSIYPRPRTFMLGINVNF